MSTWDPSLPLPSPPDPPLPRGRSCRWAPPPVLSPAPSAPQEHSFIKRYEMLEVDVASWFKDVMAKTESPRTSGVLSQHHLPFFR